MDKDSLLKLAAEARENAYAPYSNFHVGCAIKTTEDRLFSGCNFENLSYGATICAERTAIGTAVREGSVQKQKEFITEILVLTGSKAPAPPCGLCLQVMTEFCTDKTIVHLANSKGIQKTLNFSDLLPYQFESLT